MITAFEHVPKRHELEKPVVRGGYLDGYCLYFRCRFDNGAGFDNAPSSPQTNWDCLVIRKRRRRIEQGARLAYSVHLQELEKPRTWLVEDRVR